jgi:translocator protein
MLLRITGPRDCLVQIKSATLKLIAERHTLNFTFNTAVNASFGVFIGLNFVAALSGALFRPGAWYEGLKKPWWRPPNWLFGPAWTVLYLTIAVAGWMVWERAGWSTAIVIYLISLAFNAGWSGVAFGLRRMDLAFGWIIAFWLSVAATILAFWPISQTAALLLVPYLCWVSFASVLNFSIWQLNKAQPIRP